MKIFILFALFSKVLGLDDARMHPIHEVADAIHGDTRVMQVEDAEWWKKSAQDTLQQKVDHPKIEAVAKNVIFYLGDGMDIKTVTAARIMKGQKVDHLPFGEEGQLHMDTLPFMGNSITFCSNRQVPDSACTGTAYHCGSKTNVGVICVSPDVQRGSCTGQSNSSNHLSSALSWAQSVGKSTGIISNLEITDASTSPTYSHSADREWQNDAKVREAGGDPNLCPDIASQLISGPVGSNIDVILGGGRVNFFSAHSFDPEYPALRGSRRDYRNLVEEWQTAKPDGVYVTSRDELLKVNTSTTKKVLGLFEPWHMSFLHEQGTKRDPSLSEMVEVAVQILNKNPNGFFLYVYNGLIDGGHHYTVPQTTLWEVIELDRALQKGDAMTEDNETLIVVSADHAHTMHFAGYSGRGRSILEYPEYSGALDNLPYNTLGYANGPGIMVGAGGRRDVTNDPFDSLLYMSPSGVPKSTETHAGDDVPIYAKGPYAHMFSGTHQQNYIPHAMGYAACMGKGKMSKLCMSQDPSTTPMVDDPSTRKSLGSIVYPLVLSYFVAIAILLTNAQ